MVHPTSKETEVKQGKVDLFQPKGLKFLIRYLFHTPPPRAVVYFRAGTKAKEPWIFASSFEGHQRNLDRGLPTGSNGEEPVQKSRKLHNDGKGGGGGVPRGSGVAPESKPPSNPGKGTSGKERGGRDVFFTGRGTQQGSPPRGGLQEESLF